MKEFLSAFILVAVFLLGASNGMAKKAPPPAEEKLFSAQGFVTEVKPEERMLRARIEGGLELTFRVDEATQITQGGEVKSLADFAIDEAVEIEYRYNENFEKVAQSIRK